MIEILKRFELYGISTWIIKEHGGLLTGLSFEPDIGLNDEFDGMGFEFFGEGFPFLHFQDGPEMLDGYVFPVHMIGGWAFAFLEVEAIIYNIN